MPKVKQSLYPDVKTGYLVKVNGIARVIYMYLAVRDNTDQCGYYYRYLDTDNEMWNKLVPIEESLVPTKAEARVEQISKIRDLIARYRLQVKRYEERIKTLEGLKKGYQ